MVPPSPSKQEELRSERNSKMGWPAAAVWIVVILGVVQCCQYASPTQNKTEQR